MKAADAAPAVSFEFYPPRTERLQAQLWAAVERLGPLRPRFVSVTYGADGSTRLRTLQTVTRVIAETDLTPAAHLTCVGESRAGIEEKARAYWEAGVRHLVALRGDPADGSGTPFTPHPQGHRDAAELVTHLKQIADFEISVAAYPETHPEAPSAEADLDHLKRKLDAGANRAITQFFFDVALYLRFRDRATRAGIDVPIVPGILPVTNVARLMSFAARCGATVPDWLEDQFEGLDDDPETRRLIAGWVAIEQCRTLARHGVTEFHFYTLNRAELTRAICHALGVREGRAPAADHVP